MRGFEKHLVLHLKEGTVTATRSLDLLRRRGCQIRSWEAGERPRDWVVEEGRREAAAACSPRVGALEFAD